MTEIPIAARTEAARTTRLKPSRPQAGGDYIGETSVGYQRRNAEGNTQPLPDAASNHDEPSSRVTKTLSSRRPRHSETRSNGKSLANNVAHSERSSLQAETDSNGLPRGSHPTRIALPKLSRIKVDQLAVPKKENHRTPPAIRTPLIRNVRQLVITTAGTDSFAEPSRTRNSLWRSTLHGRRGGLNLREEVRQSPIILGRRGRSCLIVLGVRDVPNLGGRGTHSACQLFCDIRMNVIVTFTSNEKNGPSLQLGKPSLKNDVSSSAHDAARPTHHLGRDAIMPSRHQTRHPGGDVQICPSHHKEQKQ